MDFLKNHLRWTELGVLVAKELCCERLTVIDGWTNSKQSQCQKLFSCSCIVLVRLILSVLDILLLKRMPKNVMENHNNERVKRDVW